MEAKETFPSDVSFNEASISLFNTKRFCSAGHQNIIIIFSLTKFFPYTLFLISVVNN
jgi:hypothetical protein